LVVERMELLSMAKKLVDHYGLDHQILKLKEENLELGAELKVYDGEITFKLIDEMADELFLLTQVALKVPEIKARVMFKAKRQMHRMRNEQSSLKLRDGILIDHYAGAVVEGAHGFME